MGFLSNLIGSIFNKEGQSSSTPATAKADNLMDADFEFMKYLNNKQPDDYIRNGNFKDVLGNIDNRVQYYIKWGTMKRAGAEEVIPSMTANELKSLLHEYEIKYKSNIKKAELVELALQSVPKEHLIKIAQDKNRLVLTEKGRQLTDSYFERKEKERDSLIKGLYKYLDDGEFEKAEESVREYETKQVFPRGLNHDWSRPDKRCIERIKEIYKLEYSDLKNTPEFVNMLKAEIALCELLGENMRKTSDRLLNRTVEDINCPSLEKYLHGEVEGGMIKGLDVNIKNLTFVYTHTKSFEASNNVELRELKNSIAKGIGEGIEILPPNNDEYRDCHPKKMKYKKGELDKVPKLPRHYGCRCMYIMSFDEMKKR